MFVRHVSSFSPDGKLLVSVFDNGSTRVWEWESGREVLRYGGGVVRNPARGVSFSGNQRHIIVAGQDNVWLNRWQVEDLVRQSYSRLTTKDLSAEQWQKYLTACEYERYVKGVASPEACRAADAARAGRGRTPAARTTPTTKGGAAEQSP